MNLPIALTAGEPAGIGPDLAILLAQQARQQDIIVIADADLLSLRADALGLPLQVQCVDRGVNSPSPVLSRDSGVLSVLHVPLRQPAQAGRLNPDNAGYVLETLDLAVDGCLDGRFGAMVTAPLHKGVINDAGVSFSGHTEYLAARTGGQPVMMLATDTTRGPLRVALATTHLPLSAVPQALTPALLRQTLTILHTDLKSRFGVATPRILVAGLNPHAGESGHMGREEIDVIEPVLQALRNEGLQLSGPLPADTLFTPYHLDEADAVMAMFHDQGLPVLKYAGFGNAVNVTLGLPIIRTSVDHGTALDKAGTGQISSGSLQAAVSLAARLVDSRIPEAAPA